MKKLKQILVLVAVWAPENENESYGANVPGIFGLNSAGDDLENCLENVREALLFHTEEEPVTQEALPHIYNSDHMLRCDENHDTCWWRYAVMDAWVEENVEFDFKYLELRDRFRNIKQELDDSIKEMKVVEQKPLLS